METQEYTITNEVLEHGVAMAQKFALEARQYVQNLFTYEPVKVTPEEHKKRMEELSIEAKQAMIEVREELRNTLQSQPPHLREIIASIQQF